MNVAQVRIPQYRPVFDEADRLAVAGSLESHGKLTEEFERRLAKVMDAKHAVAVSSCTHGLALSLMALGVGRHDRVVVPDLTFVRTANAVRLAGAEPVFADVRKDDFCLDWDEAAGTHYAVDKAVLPVHLNARDAGSSDEMLDVPKVYDAAQALGAVKHRGALSVVSFAFNKVITTRRGGCVFTDDAGLADEVRKLAYDYNFLFDDIRAALGLSQLDKLPQRLDHMRRVWAHYKEQLPDLTSDGEYVWNADIQVGRKRDAVAKALLAEGIETRPFYPPFAGLPVAKMVSASSLWLPSSSDLTHDQVQVVCDAVKRGLK